MAIDDKTRTELEAAVFRRLVEHLRARTDVQNIDLMNLAGFCRNCLSNWLKEEADARGADLSKDESREAVYGMPYETWKQTYQAAASAEATRSDEEGPERALTSFLVVAVPDLAGAPAAHTASSWGARIARVPKDGSVRGAILRDAMMRMAPQSLTQNAANKMRVYREARHARPCAGHPRLWLGQARKAWMTGTSPAMTEKESISMY